MLEVLIVIAYTAAVCILIDIKGTATGYNVICVKSCLNIRVRIRVRIGVRVRFA